MEIISQKLRTSTAEYDLVLSCYYLHKGRDAVRTYYVRRNDDNYAEFLVKDILRNSNFSLGTTDNDVIIVLSGNNVEKCAFAPTVQQSLSKFLSESFRTTDYIPTIKTYGIMEEYHNWILWDAGFKTSDCWVDSQKVFSKKMHINYYLQANVWFEKPYYFSAEFKNVFPGARFDFFSETGDLYKGIHSETLKKVIDVNYKYFMSVGNIAKLLFDYNNCIVKNKTVCDKKACADCVRKFVIDSAKDPQFSELSQFIGQITLDSAAQLFLRFKNGKKSKNDV